MAYILFYGDYIYSQKMPKSSRKKTGRTSRHNKTMKMHGEHQYTLCGLHKWYEAMFEKLGWMILAYRNGWHDMIATYKNSVQRLCDAIANKIKEVREADRKDDLKIMWQNVIELKEHIHRDFP